MVEIRKLDELNRVVLPKHFCQHLDLLEGDELNVHLNNRRQIIITKSIHNCKICMNDENLFFVDDVGYICQDCAIAIEKAEWIREKI